METELFNCSISTDAWLSLKENKIGMGSGIAYVCREDVIDVNLLMEHFGSIVRHIEKGTCKETRLGYRYQSYRICRYLCS
jgi:hypothetical protein